MAAESVSGTSLSGEMNRVTQVVGWALVKHRLLDTERDAKWHNILYAVCECVPEAITVETSRLLTLVSLMVKVNADVETMAANLERIVTLLGKMVLFPEMVGVRERLLGLLDEGKCQIVLQRFSPNSAAANDEVRALFKQYFGPSKSLDSGVGQELHRLMRGPRKRARSADVERFLSEHSLSGFKEDLAEFLFSAVTRLSSFHFYNRFKDQVQFQNDSEGVAGVTNEEESSQDDQEEEEEEEGEREGDDDKENGVCDEEESRLVVKEEEEEEREGEREEAERDGGSETEEVNRDEVEEEDSDFEFTVLAKKRRKQEEEEIEWDTSSEFSPTTTPPSRLPERKEVTARNRSSLVNKYHRTKWTSDEVQELIKGVEKHGVGKWKLIMKHRKFAPHRTTVDLKDKWRNLQGRK